MHPLNWLLYYSYFSFRERCNKDDVVSEAEPAIKDFCCAFTVQQYDGDGIKCHKIDGDVHKMGEKHRHSASM